MSLLDAMLLDPHRDPKDIWRDCTFKHQMKGVLSSAELPSPLNLDTSKRTEELAHRVEEALLFALCR